VLCNVRLETEMLDEVDEERFGVTMSTDQTNFLVFAYIGLVLMLSPEQVERKVGAILGEKWGRLTDQLATLYGGILARIDAATVLHHGDGLGRRDGDRRRGDRDVASLPPSRGFFSKLVAAPSKSRTVAAPPPRFRHAPSVGARRETTTA